MPDGTSSLVPASRELADYQKQGGFKSFGARDILGTIREAGLRGRGGSGMATADKWQVVIDNVARRGGPARVVCNAYDADEQSLIAATLTQQQPFRVLEGVALAALTFGADEAFIYLRSSNQAGRQALHNAIGQAQDNGFLNGLTINLVGVEVGFMGGEESTMLEVIRGRRAMASQRPPYPAQIGLDELPTLVDNVETLVNVVTIMNQGAAAYRKTGTTASPGTKFVTIVDASRQPKLVEVSLGTPIATILQKAGVAVTPETVRGIVVGGPEGGVLPPAAWNTPFDFEPLKDAGTIMGSATIEVLPATTCMVEWARERMDTLAQISCGKCIPCRSGTKRMAGTLEGIMSDVGADSDLALLEEFSNYIPTSSLCGFGWHATHPVITTMRYYRDDFSAHLKGECPTGTCIPRRSHRFAKKGVL